MDRAEYIKNYLEINYSVKSKEDIASELGLKHSRGVKRKKDIFMSIEGVIA